MDRPTDQGEAKAPVKLRREFWTLVVVFNIALLATGAGVLMLVFGRHHTLAWTGIFAGLTAGGYGYGRYRRRTPTR